MQFVQSQGTQAANVFSFTQSSSSHFRFLRAEIDCSSLPSHCSQCDLTSAAEMNRDDPHQLRTGTISACQNRSLSVDEDFERMFSNFVARQNQEVQTPSCHVNSPIPSARHTAVHDTSSSQSTTSEIGNLAAELENHQEELTDIRATLNTCQAAQLESEECRICFEALLVSGTVIGQCGHMFHRSCILRHLARGTNRCPLCTKPMEVKTLVSVRNGVPEREGDGEYVKQVIGMVEEKLEGMEKKWEMHKEMVKWLDEMCKEGQKKALREAEGENMLSRLREREEELQKRLNMVFIREQNLAEWEPLLRRAVEVEKENSRLRMDITALRDGNGVSDAACDGERSRKRTRW